MYLSRVVIDDVNRQKIRDLNQLGAFHNWVEQSFPDTIAAGERPRHLWRIDNSHGSRYLIVLSPEKPDAAALEKYGVSGSAETRDYEPILAALYAGQRLRFRLTANPTHAAPVAEGASRGKVYPHVTVEQQMTWFLQKAALNGFVVLPRAEMETSTDAVDHYAFDITQRDRPILRHRGHRSVTVSRVSFEGVLEITDLPRFKDALITGIGREKAYGMGLMTVIPLATP